MKRSNEQVGDRPRVVIAGGGVAGLEAMLALRELAGDLAEIELHAPRREFSYRPLAVGEPFGVGRVVNFDLRELAERAGAAFSLGSVLAVDGDRRHVVTHDGVEVPYDFLLLAPGVRMLWAVPGTVAFWGVADEGAVAEVMQDLVAGKLSRVAFTMPSGPSWPFPAYELALLAATELERAGVEDAELIVVTPEDEPLGLFGLRAGQQVGELLSKRGIRVVAGTHPVRFERGRLEVAPGEPIEVDAVISAPRLEGRRVAGVPHDPDGFIGTDEHGGVIGMERVYACGDVTAFPVKQGGIAAQQADAAAEAIAAELGADVKPEPFDPILRGTLWTGEKPKFLYGKLSGGHGETSVLADHAVWEHEGKIVGKYLAPFLDAIPGAEKPASQSGIRSEAPGVESRG